MANNTFTKNYVDGDPLLEDDLDTGFETVQPSIANMAFSTTGSASGDVLASTGSNLAPNYITPNTFAATITSTGANAIIGAVSSVVATTANLVLNSISSTSAASANIVGNAMTASGANNVIAVANSVSVPTAVLANNIINAISSCSSASANIIADQVKRSSASSVGHLGVAVSGIADHSTTSSSFTNISGASCTIITAGRPVLVGFMPFFVGTSSFNQAYIKVQDLGGGGSAQCELRIFRDAVQVASIYFGRVEASGSQTLYYPPSSFQTIDVVTAGTYIYTADYKIVSGTEIEVNNCSLYAYEL